METLRIAAGFEFGSACDPGRKRRARANQDTIDLVLPAPGEDRPPLLVVADGMGGYRGGAVAGQLVAQAVRETYLGSRPDADPAAVLRGGLQAAHSLVRQRGAQDAELESMGSTLVAAVLTQARIYVLNVGDSRAYLLRGREVHQVSQDHSWVAEQVRAGLLTPQQAQHHPKRNRLSMSISARRPDVQPHEAAMDLEPDDILVLCSDGLWGVVPEALIWASASELEPQAAADKLVALANANGGPDNISVIIARRHQPERRPPAADMDETNP